MQPHRATRDLGQVIGQAHEGDAHEPGHHGGVDAAQAQRQHAQQQAHQPGHQRADPDADPGRNPQPEHEVRRSVRQQRRGVSAQPKHGGKAEIDHVDETGREIESHRLGAQERAGDQPAQDVLLVERWHVRQDGDDHQQGQSQRGDAHAAQGTPQFATARLSSRHVAVRVDGFVHGCFSRLTVLERP